MSSKLVLKPLWSNGSCTYVITFKKMSAEDRREVEQLADEAGYIRNDGIWAPPGVAGRMSEFFRAMANAGFGLEFDDPKDAPFDLQRLHLSADSLGDRVRLLSALEQHSSLTLAETLTVFQEIKPIRGLANMVIDRLVEVDLDTALLAPETIVRRYRS